MHIIEDTIRRVASSVPPSMGDNLLGFRIDMDLALEGQVLLESHDLTVSDSPLSMINVTATLATDVERLAAVAQMLRAIWDAVAYRHFEASSVQQFRDATILRFITVISDDAFFVSGTVRVKGDSYPRLVANYERDWKCTLDVSPVPHV